MIRKIRNGILMKLISIFLIIVFTYIPTDTLAQNEEGTYEEGRMDGERSAQSNLLWLIAGCGCGLWGVGAAYLIVPSPPEHYLIGKSPEYVLGFTEGYRKRSRGNNAMWASVGCAGLTVFVYYLIRKETGTPLF